MSTCRCLICRGHPLHEKSKSFVENYLWFLALIRDLDYICIWSYRSGLGHISSHWCTESTYTTKIPCANKLLRTYRFSDSIPMAHNFLIFHSLSSVAEIGVHTTLWLWTNRDWRILEAVNIYNISKTTFDRLTRHKDTKSNVPMSFCVP